MDIEKTVTFVDAITESAELSAAFKSRQEAKQGVVDVMRSELTPDKKAELREGFSFNVFEKKGNRLVEKQSSFDERGSEYAVDTFGATRKGYAMTQEDFTRAQNAMASLLEITRKALAKKDANGQPVLRSIQEVMDEVYTPLVREGVLPENFVINKYSEVQRLLNETFKSYAETLEDERRDTAMTGADASFKLHGGGGKLDRLSGLSTTVKNAIASKVSEDTQRKLGIAAQGVTTVIAIAGAKKTVGKAADGPSFKDSKLVEQQKKFLDPESFLSQDQRNEIIAGGKAESELLQGVTRQKQPDGSFTYVASNVTANNPLAGTTITMTPAQLEAWEQIHGLKPVSIDPDDARAALASATRANLLTDALNILPQATAEKLEPLKDWIIKQADTKLDSDGFFYTTEGIKLIKDGIVNVLGITEDASTATELANSLAAAHHERRARELLRSTVLDIDSALSAACANVNGKLGVAVDGQYAKQINLDTLDGVTAPDFDSTGIVGLLAGGFEPTLKGLKLAPEHQDAFSQVGSRIGDSYRRSAAVSPTLETEANEANVQGLITAVDGAVTAAIDRDFEQLVNGLDLPVFDEEEVMLALDESDEEMREFENMLVLMDSDGISMAEQRSVERLIEKIEKDRKNIALVNKVGGAISGAGGSTVGIAAWGSEKLTDVVAGQIVGPLKAAKLIMDLAIKIKEAAERKILIEKFKLNLQRSRTAVSALSSPIQGFLNNKTDQQTFRGIEIALQTVEIAATVLGSVPEPLTMAVGKVLGAVNTAAQESLKFSEQIYTEVKLASGWQTTKEAIQNPSDRAKGLQALRLNATLGMHSVAWAGMERSPPDPVARMVLESLGLNENTLAVSGSESKVRKYLETVLHEDIVFKDPDKIQPDWVPRHLELTLKDWCVVTARARREAVPVLESSGDERVIAALKLVQSDLAHLDDLEIQSKVGNADTSQLEAAVNHARVLRTQLSAYQPKSAEGGGSANTHEQMSSVADNFIKMAADHHTRLDMISITNANFPIEKERDVVSLTQELIAFASESSLTAEQRNECLTAFRSAVDEIKVLDCVSNFPSLGEAINEFDRQFTILTNRPIANEESDVSGESEVESETIPEPVTSKVDDE
ncbi:hypothetical protein [Aporhodopirellula aestuarii]|uniref:Uncharacterized protein n=1 Tax=Aporhodopirellula aestuarii TaxID=2950107 RepID=A0ABT0TZA7_9BACT|nr:hypothetical protein [Aporhodopirellula aestuarii]MCM2369897.1 hypothetical protein [Aporhodopirellula aestuarii]